MAKPFNIKDYDPSELELFNKVTGETAPVVWFAWCAPKGCYEVAGEPRDAVCYYRADGNPQYSTYPNWIIRNKPPQPCCDAAKELAELRERVSNAFKTVKRYIDETNGGDAAYIWAGGETVMFSDFIQPEPVDPLVEALGLSSATTMNLSAYTAPVASSCCRVWRSWRGCCVNLAVLILTRQCRTMVRAGYTTPKWPPPSTTT